jgi:hypothetical protein
VYDLLEGKRRKIIFPPKKYTVFFYVKVFPVSNKKPSLSHPFLSPRNFPLFISLSHPFHPKEPKKGKCLDAYIRAIFLSQGGYSISLIPYTVT